MDANKSGFQKFTCYFCNETIENQSQMGHTAVCSSVLVPCPNRCGSYVPRGNLHKHKRECLNRSSKSLDFKLPTNEIHSSTAKSTISTGSLERHPNGYLKDPKLQDEVSKLSKRLAYTEQQLQFQRQNLQGISLPYNMQQTIDSVKNKNLQQGLDIEKLKYQTKTSLDWKNKFESELDNLKRFISVIQNSNKEINLHWNNLQERIILLENQQIDSSYLKATFTKEQSYTRQIISDLEQDLITLKTHFSQEHATFATVLNSQKKSIDDMKAEIEKINELYEENKAKMTNIVFDLRAASQIASETAERIEICERDFENARKDVNQMKLDLEILEGLASSHDPNIKPGRLIWKITDVSTKMLKAKDFGSILKSPVFYTHEYGYKIKILLYMNGLNKWKDRYALLCIYVIKGEYDMLLKWPCHIEANVTLRNVVEDDKVKCFSKYITAKREQGNEDTEEPQESSSSYIFIPHSTLLKEQYVKDDTLFLDIKIQKNTKLETNL